MTADADTARAEAERASGDAGSTTAAADPARADAGRATGNGSMTVAADSTRAEHERADTLSAISRRVIHLYKQDYGRGPTQARTYHWRDLVVVVLRDGFTPLEQTLREGGRAPLVFQLRAEFQQVMAAEFKRVIEEELRREVIAVMSASHHEPDVNAEIFLLAPPDAEPAQGDGAPPGAQTPPQLPRYARAARARDLSSAERRP